MIDAGKSTTNAGESQTEAAIETALRTIGRPEFPQGMEQRLHRALQERATSSARQPWALLFSPRLVSVSLCGLALVAAATVALRHAHSDKPQALAVSRGPMSASTRSVTPGAASRPRVEHAAPRRALRILPQHLPLEQTAAPGPQQDFDHPAPPLPLTEQEKLLIRIAHRGDPVEMAALDDAQTRSIDFEAQKTQFDDFFYLHPTETTYEDQ